MPLSKLTQALIAFRDERNWAQFHTLRNLIVSLNLEAGELLELTQWKDDATVNAALGDVGFQEALRDECADILLYLLLIADAPVPSSSQWYAHCIHFGKSWHQE